MPIYYVNNRPQPNGDHEVHRDNCIYLPADRKELGFYLSCSDAIKVARRIYKTANGCVICSPTCHTS